jgi:hypothetical protein
MLERAINKKESDKGDLKAIKIKAGWRIRSEDLMEYTSKLQGEKVKGEGKNVDSKTETEGDSRC